eukprot:CAMPEP_0167762466 /NCGR_PEP_ID=MMETSP0110_2-20121227/12786_1 /TAXON_ID=629695 /ORGANISM="Gymnochlora sp., Strain CCMP2014" /LENGTH=504 /DNA_ID=CAMNT_0007649349 /DNA_START=3 /DNA_END=1520 /DNA_ORIENTATION=-
MAGGNAELAVNLFLSMSGGTVEGPTTSIGGGSSKSEKKEKPKLINGIDFYTLVWPEPIDIPRSWTEQGLEFSKDIPLGIAQPKNGPCGVLAAVQAVLVYQCRKRKEFSKEYKFTSEDLARAITTMISIGGSSGSYKMCTWTKNVGQEITIHEAKTEEELYGLVKKNIKSFQSPGGCILLVYSAILTRTPEKIKKDMLSEGADKNHSLVISYGHPSNKNWQCSSELVSLLIRGKAGGNVGAYGQIGGQSHDWDMKLGIGLLTLDEHKSGIPVANSLKNPSAPVWILHGGDHFTTLWSNEDLKDEKDEKVTFYHFNGLAPAGPRLSTITLQATNGVAKKAPEKRADTYFKPLPGEIDSVIQAHPEDRKARPGEYETWRYEVVLAVEDKSVQGAQRPKNYPKQPVFEQGPLPTEAWRCRECYADRFKTMWFKLNPKGTTVCEGPCKKPLKECGWSFYLEFKLLPLAERIKIQRREAPKLSTILWTRWPMAKIEFNDLKDFNGQPPSS